MGEEIFALSGATDLPTTLLLSLLDALSEVETDRQREIVLLRNYFQGDQGVELSDRLKQFLGPTQGNRAEFRFNLLESVVGAVVERLRVKGIDCEDTDQAQWFQDLWRDLSLDTLQEEVYETTLLEGEYFAIIEWIDNQIDISFHERFTDVNIDGGTGTGCTMIYPHGDVNKTPICCVKQWSEFIPSDEMGNGNFVERRNVYFDDHVEKYVRDNTIDWVLTDNIAYRKGRDNQSLGIPVIHFKNRRLRSEVWNALPMQDLTNKSIVDLAATSDQTAFRIFYSLGFIPTVDGEPPAEDGSNWLDIEPGQVIGTTQSKSDAEFGAIDPADITSVLKMVHESILWVAMITQTPISRFLTSGQVAREETLKEQEGPLLAKVLSRQILFGKYWEELLKYCRRLRNAYAEGEVEFDETRVIEMLWDDPELRNEATRIDTLVMKRELAVPFEQLWTELGYTEKQRQFMKTTEEYQRMLAALGPVEETNVDQENGDVTNLE